MRLLLLFVTFICVQPWAAADFLLVPRPSAATTYAGKITPFLQTADQLPSARFQQVFNSSDFDAAGFPVQITALSFARYPQTAPIDVNLADISVHLSTTSRNLDSLSSVFAQNVGADDRLLFSGSLRFFEDGGAQTGGIGETYNIRIGFQTPFFYDPGIGNLLLDVVNHQSLPQSAGTHYLVGLRGIGSAATVEGNADSPIGGTGNTGLIVGFTYAVVPEPSPVWLFLMGTAIIAGAAIGRNRNRLRRQRELCR